MTWHNQLVILKNLFQNLGATIGTAFINLLKPVVSVLNKIVAAVTSFAEKVVNALGVIFGWTIEIENVGITDAFGDAAEFADDLASGTGKAADNAKKLKQQLQGFDELNVLQSDKDSGGGSGGGSGSGAGAGGASDGGLKYKIKEQKGLFESEIDTLYDLGKYIGKTLTDSMNSIDWDSVYEGARNFGKGLANFLNGLISPDLFGALGRTIAGSINTVLYSTLSFAETFDWQNLGDSIATGINEFFRTFNFAKLGDTIYKWTKGLITAITTAIGNTDWKLIGEKIGQLINRIHFGDLLIDLGYLALEILNALGEAIKTLVSKNPLAGALATILVGIKVAGMVDKVSGLASSIMSSLGISIGKQSTEGVATALGNVFSKTGNVASKLTSAMGTFTEWLAGSLLGNIVVSLGVAFAAFSFGKWLYENTDIGKAADWVVDTLMPEPEATDDWTSRYNSALKFFEGQGAGDAMKNAETVADAWGKAIDLGYESTEAWTYAMNVAKRLGGNVPKNLRKVDIAVGTTDKTIKSSAKNVDSYSNSLEKAAIGIGISSGAFAQAEKSISGSTRQLGDSTKTTSSLVTSSLGAMANSASRNGSLISGALVSASVNVKNNVSTNFTQATTSALAQTQKLQTNANSNFVNTSAAATSKFSAMKSNSLTQFTALQTGAISSAKSLNTKSNEQFAGVKAGASSAFGSLAGFAKSGMSKASNEITRQNWNGAGTHLVDGLKIGISNRWNQGGNNGLLGTIVGLAKNLTSKLKSAFGIHSPSRVWRDEIGEFLPKGLELGIQDGEGSVFKTVDDFSKDITQRMANGLNNPFDNFNDSMKNVSTDINGTVRTNLDNGNLASDISMGIASGMSTTQAEQNALLREQNELLTQLLAKDMGISADDIYNTVRRKNRQNYNQTGRNALVY